MTVKVIAFTKPIDDEFGRNLSEFIAYVARISNPGNQWNHDTAQKLLDYLKAHKHFSPFEMADIVLEIETTRDIARQLLRHRSFSFQEFSQRYAKVENFSKPKDARLQDEKNRQNSIEFDDENIKSWWIAVQDTLLESIEHYYDKALQYGIAKEVARIILPEGLTKSRLYMKGSIRSWIHYLEVRLDESTQKEHRELAQEISDAIESVLHD